MGVEAILSEMNVQNVIHMDARNGNRTENILRCEREINRLGFKVGFKHGSFYIINHNRRAI
jgi:hypothetical protein